MEERYLIKKNKKKIYKVSMVLWFDKKKRFILSNNWLIISIKFYNTKTTFY